MRMSLMEHRVGRMIYTGGSLKDGPKCLRQRRQKPKPDTGYHRFLWREGDGVNITGYQVNWLTAGDRPSLFIAIKTLKDSSWLWHRLPKLPKSRECRSKLFLYVDTHFHSYSNRQIRHFLFLLWAVCIAWTNWWRKVCCSVNFLVYFTHLNWYLGAALKLKLVGTSCQWTNLGQWLQISNLQ